MILRITDIGWGINRRTGQRSEDIVEEREFKNPGVGPLPPVGPLKHVFVVEEAKESALVILLSEKAGKIELEVGKPFEHHPLSLDGGHYYRLELE